MCQTHKSSEGRNTGKEEVGDDADGPHVGGEGGALAVDNLRSDVLGLTVLKLDDADDALGQWEVADLDFSGTWTADQKIQRSESKVANALGVHVLEAIKDLDGISNHEMYHSTSIFIYWTAG